MPTYRQIPITTSPRGFTIIELLIVIVILGILASITILAFNGIQSRAYDNMVKADISVVQKNLELAKVDLGRYPNNHGEMPNLKVTKTVYDTAGSNIYICINKVTDAYAYAVRSKSKKGFVYTNTGMKYEGPNINETDTCQRAGLTDAYDPNGYSTVGYADDKFGNQWPTQYNPDLKWVQQ